MLCGCNAGKIRLAPLDIGGAACYAAVVDGKGQGKRRKQMARMKLHPSLTPSRIANAVERSMCSLDNPGFCLSCGAEADGCEPDARNYVCDECGEAKVYGAEELLFLI
jgi:hypothetical protein